MSRPKSTQGGYSLLELVITLGVLAILVMGTVPLAQNAVKREKETKLRDALRQMRLAIDEFKRDSLGACPQGSLSTGNPTVNGGAANVPVDPRSRVVIDDCKIFDSANLDRYPPSLELLVKGVRVKARGVNLTGGRGLHDDTQATELNENKEIIKVYLRDVPTDPMTGETDWKIRSSYQSKDLDNWDDVNVFDVRSASNDESLNGEKYSDW